MANINVTMAILAKHFIDKERAKTKNRILTVVVFILGAIVLGATVATMVICAFAVNKTTSTQDTTKTESRSFASDAFAQQNATQHIAVEQPATTTTAQVVDSPIFKNTEEPVKPKVEYVGTDEFRCYMESFPYKEERNLVAQICNDFGVPESMVLGICYHESRFQTNATNINANGTRDWGMAQCNDTTFAELQKRIGISSMSELLDARTSIRACCALLQYYQELGLQGEDLLLAYQQGYGGYKAVIAGETEPWAAFSETKACIDVFDAYLADQN